MSVHADKHVMFMLLACEDHICTYKETSDQTYFLCPHLSMLHVCVYKQDLRPRWTALDSLLCGAFAGAVAKTVIAPLDRTKIIFQGKNNSP